MKHPQSIKGFTLAEILITLLIIGVIAAITIPVFMSNYKKFVYVNELKVLYNKLQNAHVQIVNELGPPSNEWPLADRDPSRPVCSEDGIFEIANLYAKYTNAALNDKIYYHTNLPDYIPTFDYPDRAVKYLNGAINDENGGIYNHTFPMRLNNGQTVAIKFNWLCTAFFNLKVDYYLIADVNGIDKPNIIGRDIFFFAPKKENTAILVPYLSDTSDCNINSEGLSCSGRIMDDGWKMKY